MLINMAQEAQSSSSPKKYFKKSLVLILVSSIIIIVGIFLRFYNFIPAEYESLARILSLAPMIITLFLVSRWGRQILGELGSEIKNSRFNP